MNPLSVLTLAILAVTIAINAQGAKKPNIILILADDLGWNDVSFHGSDQIPTPNIDALAYNGMILNSHYMQPLCTPSRASLMTGKYAIYTGLQGIPLNGNDRRSLPDGKILPEYMRELGYTNRLIGKWHLGHTMLNQTPTYRGFDSHFGYWTGFTNYYDHVLAIYMKDGVAHYGHDLYRDTTSAWDLQGQYATRLYSEEAKRVVLEHDTDKPLFLMMSHMAPHAANDGKLLEAPQETIDKFSYIPNVDRRTYAAMVSELDDSVGVLIQALKDKDMLDNSIIIFSSDNGGSTIGRFPNWASNYPLRGMKETLWEGGVRVPACIWSPLLQGRGIHNGLIHVSDWFATFISIAGGDTSNMNIDGLNQWPSLLNGTPSPRREILLNINDEERNSAIRSDNWKLIVGSARKGAFDIFVGDRGTEVSRSPNLRMLDVQSSPAAMALAEKGYTFDNEYAKKIRQESIPYCPTRTAKKHGKNTKISNCNPTDAYSLCLFDISKDPCETKDLSKEQPALVLQLLWAITGYMKNRAPQMPPNYDPNGLPELYNYTWTHWVDQKPTTPWNREYLLL